VNSFSIVGQTMRATVAPASFVASRLQGGRYADPRSQEQRRRQILSAGQPKRLRDSVEPPAAPVLRMATHNHKRHFVALASYFATNPTTKPEAAIEVIRTAARGLPVGVVLARSSCGRHIIKVTLQTRKKFSKFEGTPAQFLAAFVRT
jgi:hypothetical protein